MNTDNHEFQQLREDVAAIKRAVIGDKEFGQDGLVKRVGRLEQWRDSVTIRAAAIGGAAGLAVWLLEVLIGKR